jgi:hypothetical protein
MPIKKFYELKTKKMSNGRIITKKGKFVGYFARYKDTGLGLFKTKKEAQLAIEAYKNKIKRKK